MAKQTGEHDQRSRYVQRLHAAYRQGRLNVFVGAGTSVESGFATWEAFNRELMHQYLVTAIGSTTPAAMLAASHLESTADELFQALGRDAVADFVHGSTHKQFRILLAKVLYANRATDLPLKSTHFQIAALASKARLFTLNFDPLLELALARRFPGRDWRSFRSPCADGSSLRGRYKVEHLHGWIEPDGKMSSGVVLTESDYLELTEDSRAQANKYLQNMLASENTTLILGMSLADANFRRVLYFLNKEGRSSRERIYVVMRQAKPAVDHYAQMHWLRRGLRLLFIRDYDEIPGLLRDIQWGEPRSGKLPRWINEALTWRQKRLPDFGAENAMFTDEWQKIAHDSLLRDLCQEVRIRFGVPEQEKLSFSLFVPFVQPDKDIKLSIVASSRKVLRTSAALYRANRRVLSIRKGQEQGIAGVSFATGLTRAVAYGEGQVDINFTSEMVQMWVSNEGYRDWRSIVAVPVIDTDHWIPVAVITMTSNMPTPFWKEFGSKQNLLEPELYRIMRRAAHFCLVGWSLDT